MGYRFLGRSSLKVSALSLDAATRRDSSSGD